jgi:hypothetical protein
VLGIAKLNCHVGNVKRPKHLDAPSYLSASPPVPKPSPIQKAQPPQGEQERLDPTHGDWEKKGIAIDF